MAAVIMLVTGWYYADPLFSILIGLFNSPRTWKLVTQAVNVLLEATPAHINIPAIEIVLADSCDPKNADTILERLAAMFKERFGIDHSTIQIEKSSQHEKEMRH